MLVVQAYTFDVRAADAPPRVGFHCYRPSGRALAAAAAKDDRDGPQQQPWQAAALTDAGSLALRREANEHVFNSGWHAALDLYGRLLEREPWYAPGYVYRAILLLKRGWRGDATAALRDADTCVALSPNWPKALETRVRCLKDLHQVRHKRHAVPRHLCCSASAACPSMSRDLRGGGGGTGLCQGMTIYLVLTLLCSGSCGSVSACAL